MYLYIALTNVYDHEKVALVQHENILTIYKDRLKAQTEFNLLSTDEATRLILRSRHNVYEFGDKASRLLAMQARKQLPRAQLLKSNQTQATS